MHVVNILAMKLGHVMHYLLQVVYVAYCSSCQPLDVMNPISGCERLNAMLHTNTDIFNILHKSSYIVNIFFELKQ